MFASIQLVRDDGAGGTGELRRMLVARARLRPSGIAWGIDYTLSPTDVMLEATLNEQWVLDEPVHVRFEVNNVQAVLSSIAPKTTTHNSYVAHQRGGAAASDLACGPPGDVVLMSLAQNDTEWDSFERADSVGVQYDVRIHVAQGISTTRSVRLTHAATSGAVPGVSAAVDSVDTAQSLESLRIGYGIIHDPSASGDPNGGTYLVPTSFVGQAVNRIGMSVVNFRNHFACPDPYSSRNAVSAAQALVRPTPASSPYDQLSSVRSTAAQEAITRPMGCTRCGQSDRAVHLCCDDDSVALDVTLTLDAVDTFHLVRLFGQPHVTDSGVLPLSPGDTSIIIFVDVANRGTIEGIFEVRPTVCCISTETHAADCDALQIRQGTVRLPVSPGRSARARFYATAELVIGVDGYCDFDLLQHGNVELSHRVTFDTAMDEYIQALADFEAIGVGPTGPECTPPATLVVSFGRELCQNPCTADQVVDAGICRPVDCVSKYGGTRNIYNVQTDMCEPTAVCDPEREDFDAPTNRCVVKRADDPDDGATTTPEPTPPPPPPPPASVPDPGWDDDSPFADVPPEGLSPPSTVCGVHGTPSADGLQCDCHPGWTNVPPRGEQSDSLECAYLEGEDYSAQTPVDNVTEPGDAGGNVIAIVFLVGVILLCACLVFCCFRIVRRRTARDQDKPQADATEDEDDAFLDDDNGAYLDEFDAFHVDDWSDEDAWMVASGDVPGGIPARPADVAATRISLRALSTKRRA